MKEAKRASIRTVAIYTQNWENSISVLRLVGPLEQAGVRPLNGFNEGKISFEAISRADLVVIQRDIPRHTAEYEEIMRQAHSKGKPVVYEIDDLLLELPRDHPDRMVRSYTDALPSIVRAMVEADAVTTSSLPLCEYLRAFNPNTWLLPNYINDRLWTFRNSSEPQVGLPVIVGYMGTDTHAPDLEMIAAPLQNILGRYGDRVRFRIWGTEPPSILRNHPRVEWISLRLGNYAEFAKYFGEQECDIVIAPLRDNQFNRCKSPLKFLEYGALGLPGVFSRLDPYASIVTHRENGFLADTPQEWEDHLSELIESSSLRHQMGRQAQETVRKNWLLSQHAHEWVRVYEKILASGKRTNPLAERVVQEMQRLSQESQFFLAEREQKILDLHAQIAKKEQVEATLRAQNEEKDRTIQVQEQTIDAKEQSHRAQAQAIQSLSVQVLNWEHRWMDLEKGVGWRVLQKLRDLRLHFAPHGSKREQALYWAWGKRAAKEPVGLSTMATNSLKPGNDSATGLLAAVTVPTPIPLRRPAEDFEIELGKKMQDWLKSFSYDLPAVVIPVFNAVDDLVECATSLLNGTERNVPIIVLDDASTDNQIARVVQKFPTDRLLYLQKQSNTGFVSTVNLAFRWCAPRDIVIVNSDVIVPPGWLTRLTVAAQSRSNIATATPFTNNGTILSIPYRNRPIGNLPKGMTTMQVDARIRESSLILRPLIPTAVGHCVYFKRSALDVVGYFDEEFSPGYGEEVDFSQRALGAGFIHVLADDLFVFHKGSQSFGLMNPKRAMIQLQHERIIEQRYPWYRTWVLGIEADITGPLARAIEKASAVLLGYRIAIDATILDGTTTGSQVLTLELIRALAIASGRFGHLTVILHDRMSKSVLRGVEQLVDEVIYSSALEKMQQPAFNLIHRPFQVRATADLELLKRAAQRFIISQLDFIAYSNPTYALDSMAWAEYRRVTQSAMEYADGVAFISQDVAADAVQQGLYLPDERKRVVYVGVDHALHSERAKAPPVADKFKLVPFILMLGTNFRHKNRIFALKALAVLIEKYHWAGNLVIAGANVSWGGSETEETAELANHTDLKSRVYYLGSMSEAEKRWLLENAALVLYPSTYEGFGLVPFEAAVAGTPTLTTRSTSILEILGDQVSYLEALDPVAGAQIIWTFLSNPERRQTQVEAIRVRAKNFTWKNAATMTWDFYKQILEMPPRSNEWALSAGDASRRQTTNPKKPSWRMVKHGESWGRLAVRAFHIWLNEGFSVLVRKAWRFVR